MQEEKVSTSTQWVTLTYATEHVPIDYNGNLTLSKRDVQLFIKRLRKAHKKTKIKYYAVGEYGERTHRPHYHIILFNADIEKIQPAWKLGDIQYGTVTGGSIAYTLKYMGKQQQKPVATATPPPISVQGSKVRYKFRSSISGPVQKQFALMSKGLGKNYLTPQMVKWHTESLHNRMYCTLPDGKKIAMPRYYKDKIYNEHQRKGIAYIAKKESQPLSGILTQATIEAHKQAFKRMHKQALENCTI